MDISKAQHCTVPSQVYRVGEGSSLRWAQGCVEQACAEPNEQEVCTGSGQDKVQTVAKFTQYAYK